MKNILCYEVIGGFVITFSNVITSGSGESTK